MKNVVGKEGLQIDKRQEQNKDQDGTWMSASNNCNPKELERIDSGGRGLGGVGSAGTENKQHRDED